MAIVTELIIGVLLFLERIDDTAGLTGIVGIAAYILGNGVAAWKREDVQPVIRSGVNYGRRVDD